MRNSVFLDASFWVAYRDEDQAHHLDAVKLVVELFRQRTHFTTTLPVLCEIQAAFSHNIRKRALVLKDLWDNPVVKMEPVSHQDQAAAVELLQLNRDKTYSLCDAVSFVVMRRLEIGRAVSFDNHFRQFGEFKILPEIFP
jgi:uncharacterized protein